MKDVTVAVLDVTRVDVCFYFISLKFDLKFQVTCLKPKPQLFWPITTNVNSALKRGKMRASKPMSVVKLKAKQSLQPFTADRNNAMGQSESTGVKCGKMHAGMSRLVWFYFSKVEEVA